KLSKILCQLWLKSTNQLINEEYQNYSIFLQFPLPIQFENQNKKSLIIEDLINFIEKMDLLIINLDFLIEIKQIIPNLINRLIKLLYKFCSDSNGNLIFCNNSNKIVLFINHLILASVLPIIQKQQTHYLSANLFEEENEIIKKPIIERSFSLEILEDDYIYYLSLLPNKDNEINRIKLICNIFSEKWQNANYLRFNPFLILKAYSTKFWIKEKNFRKKSKQFRRPPQHNEWIPLITDYALALKLAQNKLEIRKKLFNLKIFSEDKIFQLNTTTSSPDWFILALFLSSTNLNSELTNELIELFLFNKEKLYYITIKIYPLNLKNYFIFFVQLNYLPFYIYYYFIQNKFILIYFQLNKLNNIYFYQFWEALHFCGFLDNLINNNQLLIYKNFPSKIINLLFRPENSLINNFSFTKYSHLLIEENNINNNKEIFYLPLINNNNEKEKEENINFDEYFKENNNQNIYWF
ncbi:hypothetical protein Mgra_00000983, partial [Meloidogyne graminicola]